MQPAFKTGNSLKGVSWPWSSTGPQQAVDFELIDSLLYTVLFISPNEYPMYPGFGSRLNEIIFENTGVALVRMINISIRNAVAVWLPIVNILDIEVTDNKLNEGQVDVDIVYSYQGLQNTLNVKIPSSGV
jgi:phage baseplate assembly protein W